MPQTPLNNSSWVDMLIHSTYCSVAVVIVIVW